MIYLDSAATSFLKPPEVTREMILAVKECASPGRGLHAPALAAAERVYACREQAAALFHVPDPAQVVFTLNATHALNIAIRSLTGAGTRVLVSGYEHNAVVRPLYASRAAVQIVSAPLFDTGGFLDAFSEAVSGVDVAVCTHVSNVFGYRLPIEEIAEICRRAGVPLIIDAAQSAGIYDMDFQDLGAAFIAMPGHKGLMGPQGTGLLLCGQRGVPLMQGGTGSLSAEPGMPEELPDRLEAGTLNVCGIAGLSAALRFIAGRGIRALRGREEALAEQLAQGLLSIDGLDVILPEQPDRTGIISVVPREISCEELAARLGEEDIAVRAGLQCAPQAHACAGTLKTGTVRFSVSPFNTPQEVDTAVWIVRNILKISYKM